MSLFDTPRTLLDGAPTALATRGHWSAFPESPSPKVYGETGQADGQAAVAALLGKDYPLQQPGEQARLATERSPYGVALDVRYPGCDIHALVDAAVAAARRGWSCAKTARPCWSRAWWCRWRR